MLVKTGIVSSKPPAATLAPNRGSSRNDGVTVGTSATYPERLPTGAPKTTTQNLALAHPILSGRQERREDQAGGSECKTPHDTRKRGLPGLKGGGPSAASR